MDNRNILMKAVLFLSILGTSSCSVKEDRTDCPCFLTVDFSQCSSPTQQFMIAELDGNLNLREVVYDSSNPRMQSKTVGVRRGYVLVSAYASAGSMVYRNYSLNIEKGNQCDSLMVHHSIVECRDEESYDMVHMHKKYAAVRLETVGYENIEDFPYQITITGNCSGLNLVDLTPLHGGFECTPYPDKSSRNSFCALIPKQDDSSLMLNLFLRGELVNSLPIGKTILESGYSWEKEDLDDITLRIDHARNSISIEILPWEDGMNGNISL